MTKTMMTTAWTIAETVVKRVAVQRRAASPLRAAGRNEQEVRLFQTTSDMTRAAAGAPA